MKDSLDFIIDSTLGYYMMHYGRNIEYYIISRDKGFEVIKTYWGSLGYSITLIEYLNFISNFKVSSKDDFVAVSLVIIKFQIFINLGIGLKLRTMIFFSICLQIV